MGAVDPFELGEPGSVHRSDLARGRLSLRVCQAWHRASEVKVLAPGISGAEG